MKNIGSRIPLDITEEQVCLDFANTLDWHASARPEETLHDYRELVTWAWEKHLISESMAQRLGDLAAQCPDEAERLYRQAISLREAIYRILSARAHGLEGEAADLEAINQAITGTLAHARLRPVAGSYAWGWSAEEDLARVIWPVVRSATALLTNPALLERVGECADDRGCGWLFIDLSKNRSRRWCDIKDCGNRAKQQRHYRRLFCPKIAE